MTLKRHLVLLLAITTVVSFVMQAFYFAFIFNERIEDARNTSFSVLRQTDILLDEVFSQVQMVGKTVSDSEDIQNYLLYKNGNSKEALSEQINRMSYLRNFLRGLVTSNDVLTDVIVADLKDGLISYPANYSFSNYNHIKNTFSLAEHDGPIYLSQPRIEHSAAFPSYAFAYILPIKHTTGMFSQRNNRLGYCIITGKQAMLQNIVDHTSISNSYVAIADEAGNVIVENASDSNADSLPSVSELIERANQSAESDILPIVYNKVKYYASIRQNDEIGWYTVHLFPESVLYKNAETLLPFGIFLALVNLLGIFIIGGGMVRSIYGQIKALIESLKYVSATKGKYRLQRSSQQEFDQISTAINTMLDDLDQANQQILQIQNRLYENELLQKQIELKALQSQINPHFLFNTLECIRSIAMLRGVGEISVLTSSMANIFRYSITGGIESTVQAECDCITDYFTILSIRHPDRFQMELLVDKKLYPCHMLKMCLQPLMENTIKHSLEETEDPILIRVCSKCEDGHFLLTFHDSGSGMSEQRLKEVRESLLQTPASQPHPHKYTSIGLTNINSRLKLYYGPAYGLSIDSVPLQGTTITLSLPLIQPAAPSREA